MTRYIIVLNHLKGVELIINSLRASDCIASNDLANALEKRTLIQDDESGTVITMEQFSLEQIDSETEKKCICRGFYKPKFCPVHGTLNKG